MRGVIWDSITGEWNSLSSQAQDYAAQQQADTPNPEQDYLTGVTPSYDLTNIPSDIGTAIDNNILSPIENVFGSAFKDVLIVGAGAWLLYMLMTQRGK